MVKHDQSIQDPKRRGRDNEHVDRRGVSQVVVQKAAPSWGGGLGASRRIPPNRGLADSDAELEQFAMDARRAPQRVLAAHLANQFSCFLADRGRPGWPRRTFQVQNNRNPLRCQSMTVSGFTMTREDRQPVQNRDKRDQKNRSEAVSLGPFTERCKTLS